MGSTPATLRPEDLLEHLEWMRRLARALTRGDAAEADDLAGDAVQAALTEPPVLEGPVRPWLAGVLRNLARLRTRGGARRRQRELAAGLPPDGGGTSPGELVERVEPQRQVAGLVVGLTEPFRSTVLLRYYEGLSAADIARRLGVPPGTVRWRLKHALEQLRVAMDRAHRGDRSRWHALLLPKSLPLSSPAATRRAPASPTGPAPAIVKGAVILMSAKAKVVVAVAVLVLLVLAVGTARVRMLARREAPPGPPGRAVATAWRPVDAVMRLRRHPGGASLVAVEAPDPEGGLRLEGQVIDGAETPLAGAMVAIDSNPPRTVVTREDGGFVLDRLMPRLYRLEARAGDLYAGPVETRVSAVSEPIVLRAFSGRKIRVQVRAGADGNPLAGAQVTLRSVLSWEGRTDAHGIVAFAGVAPGWLQLRADAAGFAPAHRMLFAETTAAEMVEVRLARGAPVAGRVADARGAPIGGALVWAALTSEPFPTLDPRLDAVTSGPDGRWRMAALGAGTYRFEASHPDHAQGGTAPTTVDGVGSRDAIDIRLEDGGGLTGEVRAADGKPLAAAEVRVAVKGGVAWRFMRDTFTDGGGRFRLRGLPRRALDVVAVHDTGSSPTAGVDLSAGLSERSVVLVISIDGAIAGTVVDGAGRPVPEAQVIADPQGGGNVEARRDWELRGSPRFFSDAGGRFRFTGLPSGSSYLLRAAVPGADPETLSLHPGVPARSGDRDVLIVVPGRGGITGSVAYEDGGAPLRFSVAVGAATRSFSGDTGEFTTEMPAGRHDVVISGATFATARVPNVDVAEGKVSDIGVVTVKRGRTVSGRVLGPNGTPVAGADVAAGLLLTGDGRKLNIPAEGHGVHETRTGDDGRFSMTGFDDDPLVVVAEREGVGRSRSIALPRGAASAELDLLLEPTGSLHGTVSRAGRPLPGTVVIADPRGGAGSHFFVVSGPDGRFDFDMLAAGAYRVSALIGEGGRRPKNMFSNSASVEEGRESYVDIDVAAGSLVLAIDVRTDDGAAVPAASIVVLSGGNGDATMDGLRNRFMTAPDGPASLHLRDWRGSPSSPFLIEELSPGPYAICAVPIPADPARPIEIERALEDGGRLPARCVVRKLDASMEVLLSVPAAWLRAPP